MTFKLMLIAAALMLPAVVQAGSQPSDTSSIQSSKGDAVKKRLVDSYCTGGSCERVYTRVDASELHRRFWSASSDRTLYNPYIVRIERDPNYRAHASQ